MKRSPRVGWLLPLLVAATVALDLWLVWDWVWAGFGVRARQSWLFGARSTPDATLAEYVDACVWTAILLLPSLAAWALLRWKQLRVRFVRVQQALGEEFLRPRATVGVVLGWLGAGLGTTLLGLAVVGVYAFFRFEADVALYSVPTYAVPAVLLIGVARVFVLSRRMSALRAVHLEKKLALVDRCEGFCRESKNPEVRESRAAEGLTALAVVQELSPRDGRRAQTLAAWFRSVERCAQVADALERLSTLTRESSKEHHRGRIRELLAAQLFDDEDLSRAEVLDPEKRDAAITVARLRELSGFEEGAQPGDTPDVGGADDMRSGGTGRDGASLRDFELGSGRESSVSRDRGPLGPADDAGGPARWLAAGERVRVKGFELAGGMLYVGQGLASVARSARVEPALIDPLLRVDPTSPARSGSGVPYWPSYSELTPKQRAAYLEWLAGGRDDASAYVGYVFLFFYGLERRLGHELALDASTATEWRAVHAEVRRLVTLHGEQRSFAGYAASFLEFVELRLAEQGLAEGLAIAPRVALALELGECARAGSAVPARTALEWARASGLYSFRTPAERCPEEFADLVELRARQHAELVPSSAGPQLVARHKPASASFDAPLAETLDVPDVAQDARFVARLGALFEACAEELAPYSRRVQSGFALDAIGLLPRALARTRGGTEAADLVAECDARLGAGSAATLETSALRRWFPPARGERWTKAEAVRVAQTLDRLGFGLEPDVRFGAPTPRADSTLELFRLADDAPRSPSEEYAGALALVQLAAAVVGADGAPGDEAQHMERHIEDTLALDDSERTRLRAHLRWRVRERPDLGGLKRRTAELDAARREETARLLLEVANADGRVQAAELAVLERIYALLGLDPKRVHADLHAQSVDERSARAGEDVARARPPAPGAGRRAAGDATTDAGDDGRAASRTAVDDASAAADDAPADARHDGRASGRAAPDAEAAAAADRAGEDSERTPADAPRVTLDPERLARKHKETAAVARLLAGIFDEEEPAPAPATEPAEAAPTVAGLDAAHADLLHALRARESWTRAEFEALSSARGLLPDGALETLNEAAFERVGAPLTEGDDPIEVIPETIQELCE